MYRFRDVECKYLSYVLYRSVCLYTIVLSSIASDEMARKIMKSPEYIVVTAGKSHSHN